MKLLAQVLYWLFIWAIWPASRIKRLLFEARKADAIQDAIADYQHTGITQYVVQVGRRFIVADRASLRKWNRSNNEKLGLPQTCYNKIGKRINFDYRNAIVYTADARSVTK